MKTFSVQDGRAYIQVRRFRTDPQSAHIITASDLCACSTEELREIAAFFNEIADEAEAETAEPEASEPAPKKAPAKKTTRKSPAKKASTDG